MKTKRAAIYNPYLDTLGGGERYTMSVAQVLSEAGYRVEVEWKDVKIKKDIEARFGLDMTNIEMVPSINRGDGYDLCFWVSDGSIPNLLSRNNILHFQVPFRGVVGYGLINKMKLFRISHIVCNSNFTKSFIDKEYGVESVVLYPPVDTENIKPAKVKTNTIIYVGRFSQLKQAKHQDVLVNAFKKLYDAKNPGWKLILAGGTDVGGKEFLESLKESADGYPISFFESPSFDKIKELYAKAKIFWSASGFDVREMENPESVEHFGITVVEAMSAGAVPIVIGAGGHKEIIEDGVDGVLWKQEAELVTKTQELILNQKKLSSLASHVSKKAKMFAYSRFKEGILGLLEN